MLKELKKCLESEKKDNTIFDIVIYGSALKGKESFSDIDIAVIFLEGNLRERLDKLQAIKQKLNNFRENKIDIKQILLKELFSPAFFAKTGIFLEGESIFNNKKFSEIIGFKPFSLFWYDLSGLNHTEKVKFNYLIAGRKTKGILKELNGQRLTNGVLKMPLSNSYIFEEILNKNKIHYFKKSILEEI